MAAKTMTARRRRHEYRPSTDAIAEFRALIPTMVLNTASLGRYDDHVASSPARALFTLRMGIQSQRCIDAVTSLTQ